MNKSIIPSVGTAAVLLLIMAGCTPVSGVVSPEASTSTSDAPSPSFADTADVPEPVDTNAGFGEAVTYPDGVAISVSVPATFTPTEYAAGADQAANVVFTVTITNGSEVNLQPSVYARVSSGGVEASSVFDSGNAVGELLGSPSTVILPGQTITWLDAYSIADPAAITYQVAPSFEYEDAIFTNIG